MLSTVQAPSHSKLPPKPVRETQMYVKAGLIALAALGAGLALWKYRSDPTKSGPALFPHISKEKCYPDPATHSPIETAFVFKKRCVDPGLYQKLDANEMQRLFWAKDPTVEEVASSGSQFLATLKEASKEGVEFSLKQQKAIERALFYLNVASAMGSAEAQKTLGDFYASRDFLFDSGKILCFPKGTQKQLKAYVSDHPYLAPRGPTGDDVEYNLPPLSLDIAEEYYGKAASQGDVDAALRAANALYEITVNIKPETNARAYRFVEIAANLGDRRAQQLFSAYSLAQRNDTGNFQRYLNLYKANKEAPLKTYNGPLIF